MLEPKVKPDVDAFNAANGLEKYKANYGGTMVQLPPVIRCVFCHQKRYYWKPYPSGNWRLTSDGGKIHMCAEYRHTLKAG